jgi:multiple sugar transport system substrate-binding protein
VLGGSTIKRILSFILIAIILTGCSKSKNDSYYNSFAVQSQTKENESENVEITKHLTMHVFYTAFKETYEKYAKQYMELHPEVNVEIICVSNEFKLSLGEITSNYLTKLNTEIISGNSADIVDVSVYSADKVAKSELFTDLYVYMNNDNTFNIDDYYGNVFSALEYDKKLYMLPLEISYGITSINNSKLDISSIKNGEGLNSKNIITLYKDWISETTEENINIFHGFAPVGYISDILEDYIDYDNKIVHIDSDEFVDLLEESKLLPTDTENIKLFPEEVVSYSSTVNEQGYSNKYLFKKYNMNYSEISHLIPGTNPDYNNSFPNINGAGEYAFSAPHVFAIPEASKEKELAWDFLHYCISEEAYDTMGGNNPNTDWLDVFKWFEGGCIPINRNNFNVVYPQFIDMQMDIGIPNREEAINELVEKIDTWNTKQSRFKSRNYELFMTLVYHELVSKSNL